MRRASLLTNVSSAAGQNVVQTAVFFVLYRYLVDRLGIEQFGIWSVVLATASAARITELGLAGSVTRFVASYRSQGDLEGAGVIVQTAAVSLAVLLAIVVGGLYPVFLYCLPLVLPPSALEQGRGILPFALMSMWCGALAGVFQGGLDGCLRSDLRAGLVIASTFVFVGMVVAGVPAYGLLALAVAQVAQGVFLVISGWLILRHVLGQRALVPVRWSRPHFRQMLGYGAGVQLMGVVMLLFEPTTKILLGRFAGLAAAGTFELAQQLVMRMRALIVESNRVIVPLMSEMEASGVGVSGLYLRNLRLLLFTLTPLFAGLAAGIPAVSEVWLGALRGDFIVMALALIAGWYLNSVTAPAYFAYLGEGRLRWLTISHAILGVSNVVVGLLLAPVFGWPGAIAAFVGSLVVGSMLPVWSYHAERDIGIGEAISRADVLLIVWCAVIAASGAGGYWLAASSHGVPVWGRPALTVASAVGILLATSRHPVAHEVLARAQAWRRGTGAVR